jgi:hypothetical protein
MEAWGLTAEESAYFAFSGMAANRTYNITDETINILFKTGEVRDISSVENALINSTVSIPIKKFYICCPKL